MDFNWMMKQLRKEKKVRQSSWDTMSYICYDTQGTQLISQNGKYTPQNYRDFFDATDWELFKSNILSDNIITVQHPERGEIIAIEVKDIDAFLAQTRTIIQEVLYDNYDDEDISNIIKDIDKRVGRRLV